MVAGGKHQAFEPTLRALLALQNTHTRSSVAKGNIYRGLGQRSRLGDACHRQQSVSFGKHLFQWGGGVWSGGDHALCRYLLCVIPAGQGPVVGSWERLGR